MTGEGGILAGKAALVTGASRNLGATIAETLADCGATVAVNYRSSAEAAAELVERLRRKTGREHVAVQADVTRSAEVSRLVETAADAFGGRLDVLVNNAGPFSITPYADLPEREWDEIWDANVKSAYLAARGVAPLMKRAGWGRIVNISAASSVLRNHSIYGLAKDALVFLTEELALELAPEVTVNAVAPGQIVESAADIAEFDSTFVERSIAATPAGRLVTRREVADIVAALCGPAFAAVTGATIPIDG
ncbi:MAG TPA: SDR family oxidoreductase, partial [Gaiellaceae bacterium]|nr:SDR family oxidoreductase [Gaiellaceae bacterium]